MTLTINLPPEKIMALQARARAEGLSAEQYARRVIENNLKSAPTVGGAWAASKAQPGDKTGRRPMWEVLADSMQDLPPEDIESIPTDGASQVDHYIYGSSKRLP
jgi:hypothetical protein